MLGMCVKLDDWAREIIADPLSKEPLTLSDDNNHLFSTYGRRYPIVDGLFDLRLLNNETTADQKIWKEGQLGFERWSSELASLERSQDYVAEVEGVREVYDEIPIEGRCLDVGGHQGRLRHYLSPGQEYLCCDPLLNGFEGLERQPRLLNAYPFLLEPLNFVCCEAEFLPFRSCSFQTVHMRSVIDHFLSPELALNEAYRVLKKDGALVVGLFVYGGKQGRPALKYLAKELTRGMVVAIGMRQFKDHHVWHPTYKDLTNLISACGFRIEKVHWQRGYNDTVCYIQARKCPALSRRGADNSTKAFLQ